MKNESINDNRENIDILETPLHELELPVRAHNVLANKNLKTIRDVIKFGLENIIKLPNAGQKTIKSISVAIEPFIQKNLNISGKDDNNAVTIELKRKGFNSFEEYVRNTYEKNLIQTPIEDMGLPTRVFYALKNAGLNTVKDVVDYGLQPLKIWKHFSNKSIESIKNSILALVNNASNDIINSFSNALENIFTNIPPKYLSIIKSRYGYDDGNWKTYEEIGRKIGVTRERIRQIIKQMLTLIKSRREGKVLEVLIENIERLLLQYNGIISVNDIYKDEFYLSGTGSQIKFMMNLVSDLYEEQYRVINEHFLTNLSDDEINKINSKIQEVAIRSTFPVEEIIFIKNLLSLLNPISEGYLSYQLIYSERIEISNGVVTSLGGRLSIPQRVKLLMRDINYPLHYTEIARLYKERFGRGKENSNLEHAIHARISNSKDFIIVDPGMFILREKFRIPTNVKKIVETSKEILRELGNISDTKYLLRELKQRKIDTGNLNEYSLKPILLNDSDFVGYRKFEIGLEELTGITVRKTLPDLMYAILLSAKSALHAKEIWKRISKQRGYPRYIIDQKLYQDERKFIKVGPATYTVRENINSFDEKSKKIINFAKEWIQFKKKPISAFLVKEVLINADDNKNIPLGLVEHVLSTDSEFKKLTKGFYTLAKEH